MSQSANPAARALAPRRHDEIIKRLALHGSVGITELAQFFDVSRETIRRDLKQLAERGQLDLIHGGATRCEAHEPPLALRSEKNADGKRAIGLAAAHLIQDDMVVFLDSGTTTLAIAQALEPKQNLTICTSSLLIALQLCRKPGIRVHILGGEIDPAEEAVTGIDAFEMISRLRFDLAFIGGGGLSPEAEITDFTRSGAEQRSRMIKAATHSYFVLDSSKFGRLTPMRIANFEQASGIIVDQSPDKPLATALQIKGLKILIANKM